MASAKTIVVRSFKILGWVLLGLLVLLLLSLIPLTQTGLGVSLADRISRPIIEDAVREQLGSEIRYDELSGRLPNLLIISDLQLSEEGEVWLRADTLVLEWNALDLLGGEVHVRQLVLSDAALLRLPENIPEPSGAEEEAAQESASIPDLRLDQLVINDFFLGEAVLGREYSLSLQGQGRYLDPNLRVELRGHTTDDTDEVLIDARFDGEVASVDATVISLQNGVLSQLAASEGRTELRARAEGPLDELEARFQAAAGRYGGLEGSIFGSMEETDRLRVDIAYEPGSFLPEEARSALGEEVRLVASGSYRDEAAELGIDRLEGAFGRVSGVVSGSFGDLLAGDVDIEGRLEEAAIEPYGAGALAGPFSLEARAEENEDALRFSGILDAGKARLRIREGSSTEDIPFSGLIDLDARGIEIGDDRLDPLLAEGLTASARIRYGADSGVGARNLNARLGRTEGRSLRLTGGGSYGLESQKVSADIDARAGAGLVGLFIENATFEGPLSLDLQASGTTEALTAEAALDLPSGQFGETRFAAGRLTGDVSGLPSSPRGALRVTSDDGLYRGQITFAMEGDRLDVSELDFNAGEITLSGQAAANLKTRAGTAELAFDAPEGTQIITGQTIGGSLNLQGRIDEDLGPVDIRLTGRGLRLDDSEIAAVNLTAKGPRGDIAFDFGARDVTAGSLFFTEATSTGALDLAETQGVRIETLRLRFTGDEERSIRLVSPTEIAWTDGIRLDETTISYLEAGQLTASGRFEEDRWQASLDARDFAIPNSDATIALNLDLDTADEIPARFAINARANDEEGDYRLTTEGRWDGEIVNAASRITRGEDEELGTINAAVPVVLRREPSLGAELRDDGLDVRVAYSDRIEPFYAFLPIDQQPVTGEIDIEVTVKGRPDAPQTDGLIKLRDSRFEERQIGLALTNLNGEIRFNVTETGTRGEVDITGSGASGRENSVRLSGLVTNVGSDSAVDLSLDLDNAQLARSGELELRVTSDLDLEGDFQELTLSGPITLDELDLAIPDTGGGDDAPTYAPVNVVRVDGPLEDRAGEVDVPVEESPLKINLDLSVMARNGLFVRGRGLESEWGANLTIEGTADKPLIGGDIRLEEGELNLAGRSFELTEGLIGFQRAEKIDPLLDVQAETEAGQGSDTVTAIVSVEGPASDPEISFRSNPPLPQEDVLALILFGRPAAELGAAEALQLAQAAATLTATGPFGGGGGITGSLRSGLGLDRLELDAAGRSLTVGKYISDNVYVSARPSIGDATTVFSVVYEISRFFNIETTLEPERQTLGANYKRDY